MRRLTATLVCAVVLALPFLVAYGCGSGGGDNGVRLSLTRSGMPSTALWVAYQNGDNSGTWHKLAPQADGSYQFQTTSSSAPYGIAVVTQENDQTQVRVILATREDGTHWTLPGNDLTGYSMPCTPIGMPDGGLWVASMFGVSGMSDRAETLDLAVPAGKRDMVAALFSRLGDNHPSKMLVERDLNVTGPEPMDIDFTGPHAFSPEAHPISASPTSSGWIAVFLSTNNGAFAMTGISAAAGTYGALPAGKRAPEDLYFAVSDETLDNTIRQSLSIFKTPAERALTLPPTFGTASVSRLEVAGRTSMKAVWAPYSGTRVYELMYVPGSQNTMRKRAVTRSINRAIGDQPAWTVVMTRNWLPPAKRSAQSLDYSLPDLSTAEGWQAAWNLNGAYPINWSVGAYLSGNSIPDMVGAAYLAKLKDGLQGQFSAARDVSLPAAN